MKTSIINLMLVLTLVVMAGCASTVPMASNEQDVASKTFKAPSPNMAGVYIYREGAFGKALKKKIQIDGVVIGETGYKTYFHKEIAPGLHTLATESEFGDNTLQFSADAGKNYYFEQSIKMGIFVGGSRIDTVSEAVGQRGVMECKEAQ